jgi:hypothetical protein
MIQLHLQSADLVITLLQLFVFRIVLLFSENAAEAFFKNSTFQLEIMTLDTLNRSDN